MNDRHLSQKTAGMPNVNSSLKLLENVLKKVKLPELADKVDLYRARRNLGIAVKDLKKYEDLTSRFGQMPRIVIPKTHIDVPDLKRLGFQNSLVAVPEVGQKTWTTYRHPLDKLHLHDHGDVLNMHIDNLPSLQMVAERNSLSKKMREKLLKTIPAGIKPWTPGKNRKSLMKKLKETASGVGHAVLEGGPGYINYGLKQLNPFKVSMADEILAKLPKDYLKKRYGVTKTSSYTSPYMQAYLAGVKLAEAQFDDYQSVSDPDGFDEVTTKSDSEDPKSFRSTSYSDRSSPATNNYSTSGRNQSTHAKQPDEVIPDQTFETNSPKRDRLRGKYNG